MMASWQASSHRSSYHSFPFHLLHDPTPPPMLISNKGGRFPRLINSMAVHVVAIGKLKLLAGGHSNWQLLAALLGPFALKLPFATRLPTSCTDLAFSLRLFLFRLHRIFFADAAAYGASTRSDRRWERALRLFHERAIADHRPFGMQLQANEEMLNALAMLAL